MSQMHSKPTKNPLHELFQIIEKGSHQKAIEHEGRIYTFRSLCDEDYAWRDQFVNMNSTISMASSMRSPTLAVATVEIDGVSVESMPELVEVEGTMDDATKAEFIKNSKYLRAYNLHTKVFSKLPREYVVALYNEFIKQVQTPVEKVGEQEIKNS